MTTDHSSMESVSHEHRKFPPASAFVKRAHISGEDAYKALYSKSIQDPETFWAEAAEDLHWFKKWDSVLDTSDAPCFKWLDGSSTNLSYNFVDRHIATGKGDKNALHWEGGTGDTSGTSHEQLPRESCR